MRALHISIHPVSFPQDSVTVSLPWNLRPCQSR